MHLPGGGKVSLPKFLKQAAGEHHWLGQCKVYDNVPNCARARGSRTWIYAGEVLNGSNGIRFHGKL